MESGPVLLSPYVLVIFQGGGGEGYGPPVSRRDPLMICDCNKITRASPKCNFVPRYLEGRTRGGSIVAF